MKATISLEGLLALIHTFSLSASNKRWLAEKLLEDAGTERLAKDDWAAGITGAWKDDGLTAEEEVALLRNARVQGVTRKLVEL